MQRLQVHDFMDYNVHLDLDLDFECWNASIKNLREKCLIGAYIGRTQEYVACMCPCPRPCMQLRTSSVRLVRSVPSLDWAFATLGHFWTSEVWALLGHQPF